ncbi:DUF202 domain-containing protein [Mesobacterium sp. TK19101]|uniref:DUF202 domain-containing protein n=1 Tax=Mesobacterium hydrothermale TaxID=3111907 RepID=A0ABU6HKW5_9RHOB|nr:DUF202 domain-containing protein [Mesobacterium sp. TK19101]
MAPKPLTKTYLAWPRGLRRLAGLFPPLPPSYSSKAGTCRRRVTGGGLSVVLTCCYAGRRSAWESRSETMINRFNDKSANERTYLAWVRTVLSIAGFGLLIEKLAATGTTKDWFAPSLIALSGVLLILVTIRYEVTRRMISDEVNEGSRYKWSERLMIGIIALLVLSVFVFLWGLV